MLVADRAWRWACSAFALWWASASWPAFGAEALSEQYAFTPSPQELIQPTTHTVLERPTSETLEQAMALIASKLEKVQTIHCRVHMSKKRDKKPTRKVHVGPLVIARERGGRVVLTRKGQTEEYIANARELWSIDYRKKEALVLPVRSPIIGYFVEQALRFNAFLAMDENTIELVGRQATNGEPCWVFEGRSPSRLRLVGVPVRTMRVWVSIRDGLPREIRIPQEKDLTIVLSDIVTNVPVADDEFVWKPRPEIRVKKILGL